MEVVEGGMSIPDHDAGLRVKPPGTRRQASRSDRVSPFPNGE